MIQVSPATTHSALVSARAAHAAGAGGAPDFADALSALLLPGMPGETDERQDPAAPGKDLPEGLLEGRQKPADEKADTDGADLPFAWFAMPQPLPVATAPLGVELPRPAPSQVPAETVVAELPELRFPGAELARAGFGTDPARPGEAAGDKEFRLPPALANAADMLKAAEPVNARGIAPKIELPQVAVPARAEPVAQPAVETVQTLAAPLIALQAEAPQPRRATARELAADAISAAAPAAEPVRSHQVAPTGNAQQPALDTTRHEWMATMIDRIEALRDSPGSRETSIRLNPDALGTVDVSIRHEGDRVHVRITADTQAARTLLNEAQPRLAELAEARGIRLGQSSVDAGTAGQSGQPRQEAPRAPLPNAPVSAPADSDSATDDRVA